MSEYYPHLREMHERLCEEYDELLDKNEDLEKELEEANDALMCVFGVLTLEEADRVFESFPEIKERFKWRG